MAEQAPPRPWTPTEKPGDTVYSHPVVYVGDHQLPDTDSDVSSDDKTAPQRQYVPASRPLLEGDLPNRPGPLKFRSSQALRADAAAASTTTGVATYQPYRASRVGESSDVKLPPSIRPKSSHQALSAKADERLPENNPFRLSKTLHPMDIAGPKSPVPSIPSPLPSPPIVTRTEPVQPNNISSRLTDLDRSESKAGLFQIAKPRSSAQAEKSKQIPESTLSEPPESEQPVSPEQTPRYKPAQLAGGENPISPEQTPVFKSSRLAQIGTSRPSQQNQPLGSPHLSQAASNRVGDDFPSVTGKLSRPVRILLINPTSNRALTDHYLECMSGTLQSDVTVYGFTASRTAPTAIESQTDAIVSVSVCMGEIIPIAHKYDAFLITTFVHHPLTAALREQLVQPVIGSLEASVYASRMCGSKFGLITTGTRMTLLNEAIVKVTYGLGSFFLGSESIHLEGLPLESISETEIENRVTTAARRLQMRGADCICLELTGIPSVNYAAQNVIGHHEKMGLVIDGLSIGVQFLVALVREGLGTEKHSHYSIPYGPKPSR